MIFESEYVHACTWHVHRVSADMFLRVQSQADCHAAQAQQEPAPDQAAAAGSSTAFMARPQLPRGSQRLASCVRTCVRMCIPCLTVLAYIDMAM